MCSTLLHVQPQLWHGNSTSDMHCESTGNFKVDKVKAKNTGPVSFFLWNSWVWLHSFQPAELAKSTHPLSVKTRRQDNTHTHTISVKWKQQQMNRLGRSLPLCLAAIVHFKAQYLEFIVENYYILWPFVLMWTPSIKSVKQRSMCHFLHGREEHAERFSSLSTTTHISIVIREQGGVYNCCNC